MKITKKNLIYLGHCIALRYLSLRLVVLHQCTTTKKMKMGSKFGDFFFNEKTVVYSTCINWH